MPRSLRVFMVLPRLGAVEDESRQAAYLYPTPMDGRFSIIHRNSQASLLPFGLNLKWQEMENGCSSDGCVNGVYDYFCVLHADVEPDKFWLATLHEELVANDLDCIHAVSPIKNDDLLTSTAVGSLTDERHYPRKLALREVHAMPRTFTLRNITGRQGSFGFPEGHKLALLPNTGCFLLRVTDEAGHYKPWVRRFPGFWFRDWFDRSGGVGCTLARTVSEDWNFGYWAAREGLKVGGTRAVAIRHVGPAKYSSEEPREGQGLATDERWLREVKNYSPPRLPDSLWADDVTNADPEFRAIAEAALATER